MKEIKKIVEQIDEELEDAEKYIKCAYRHKVYNPSLADVYYHLSLEEMNHVTILHEASVKLINEYSAKGTIPEGMQTLYDYLHDRHIKWARKIKTRQEQFVA
jgi:hypothetical protein